MQAFGDILNLVPVSESVTKLSAVCTICFKPAAFTRRKTQEDKVIIMDSFLYSAILHNKSNGLLVLYTVSCGHKSINILPLFSASWVLSCFHNPLNSDMDYMIILVHAYTRGGWAHQQRVSTTFLTWKNSIFFIVLLTGFEPRSFGL